MKMLVLRKTQPEPRSEGLLSGVLLRMEQLRLEVVTPSQRERKQSDHNELHLRSQILSYFQSS